MAWVMVDQSLPDHYKTIVAAEQLRCDTEKMVGHLVRLWGWAMDSVNGEGALGNMSARALAQAARWTGKPDAFLDALLNCGPPGRKGFIECRSDGLYLHDWAQYSGRLADEQADKESQETLHYGLFGLHKDRSLAKAVRARDGNTCQFCRSTVNWRDRRGPMGGTYVRVDEDAPVTLDNVLVACRKCAAREHRAHRDNREPEAGRNGLNSGPTPTQVSSSNLGETWEEPGKNLGDIQA